MLCLEVSNSAPSPLAPFPTLNTLSLTPIINVSFSIASSRKSPAPIFVLNWNTRTVSFSFKYSATFVPNFPASTEILSFHLFTP